MLKITAFNGSARKDGNTAILLNAALAELKKKGFETELVQLAGKPLRGCTACMGCFKNKDKKCILPDDGLNGYIEKMAASAGVLIGSPTYFADVSTDTKALIERAGYVSMANGGLFARKAGAAVVAVRRGGAVHAFDTINHFFTITQMIIPGSNYWNVGVGRAIGEVENDKEGLTTMKVLGENMAWLLSKLHANP
ncbi:MAG: FMN reductase [Elusimicrobia bacterium GWC2_51_8]|nr:MAG: FMN reductase [Elusimicrobia bacterium GWA2_51_34]OGR63186.1 MAG: FMN reductase [Elusimicrobia bacterium GWC2_51_8]OGR85966.1 MAG: FMN reductase [Elusimicrobia bacterium GWF2_52_66]HAF96639.1 flavodoxin family protein [Elusimicrobiota bacterium]HCE97310.1 flavodoxin family protein [Elusimicrobiota bacterium]